MKYTKRFQLSADRTKFINNDTYIEPHASYTIEDEHVQYNKDGKEQESMYFYIKTNKRFFLRLNAGHPLVREGLVDMNYSTDLINWNVLSSVNNIEISPLRTVYFKGFNMNGLDGSNRLQEDQEQCIFSMNIASQSLIPDITFGGNIMSLIDSDNFINQTQFLPDWCFAYLFNNFTYLVSAENVILPSTILSSSCYRGMFTFCPNLVTAPTLPALTLVDNCYSSMFSGCSSLNYIKAMFTTQPSNTYTYNWVRGVASTGTFVKNSAATWNVTGNNGVPSGWTVETANA